MEIGPAWGTWAAGLLLSTSRKGVVDYILLRRGGSTTVSAMVHSADVILARSHIAFRHRVRANPLFPCFYVFCQIVAALTLGFAGTSATALSQLAYFGQKGLRCNLVFLNVAKPTQCT